MIRAGLLALLLTPLLTLATGCGGPKIQRGTDDPSIDLAAMSTRLDRVDLEQALDTWYAGFAGSGFVKNAAAGERSISVLAISNETSEHIGSSLANLITSVETHLVNDGVFAVVSNDQIAKDAILAERLRGDSVDPETMAALGLEYGVHYFVHGRVGESAEKTSDARRVQYFLFLKVTEVETRRIVFQQQIDITKQISG